MKYSLLFCALMLTSFPALQAMHQKANKLTQSTNNEAGQQPADNGLSKSTTTVPGKLSPALIQNAQKIVGNAKTSLKKQDDSANAEPTPAVPQAPTSSPSDPKQAEKDAARKKANKEKFGTLPPPPPGAKSAAKAAAGQSSPEAIKQTQSAKNEVKSPEESARRLAEIKLEKAKLQILVNSEQSHKKNDKSSGSSDSENEDADEDETSGSSSSNSEESLKESNNKNAQAKLGASLTLSTAFTKEEFKKIFGSNASIKEYQEEVLKFHETFRPSRSKSKNKQTLKELEQYEAKKAQEISVAARRQKLIVLAKLEKLKEDYKTAFDQLAEINVQATTARETYSQSMKKLIADKKEELEN